MMRFAIAGGTGLAGRYAREALFPASGSPLSGGGAVLSAAAGCG